MIFIITATQPAKERRRWIVIRFLYAFRYCISLEITDGQHFLFVDNKIFFILMKRKDASKAWIMKKCKINEKVLLGLLLKKKYHFF